MPRYRTEGLEGKLTFHPKKVHMKIVPLKFHYLKLRRIGENISPMNTSCYTGLGRVSNDAKNTSCYTGLGRVSNDAKNTSCYTGLGRVSNDYGCGAKLI